MKPVLVVAPAILGVAVALLLETGDRSSCTLATLLLPAALTVFLALRLRRRPE